MKARRFVMGTAIATLIAAGCSGGSELSLDEYFTKLNEIQVPFEQGSQDRAAEAESSMQSVSSESEALPLLKRYLEETVTATDDLVTELETINPPSEVKSGHANFVSAMKDIRDATTGVIDRFDEFGSVDEVVQFLTTDLADVGQRADDACRALQAVADDNDIDVGLSCN